MDATKHTNTGITKNTKLSHAQGRLLVRWARRNRGVSQKAMPLDYLYKVTIEVACQEINSLIRNGDLLSVEDLIGIVSSEEAQNE